MSEIGFKLLVGLGNPGSKYKQTRHNIGFMALERLAAQQSVEFKESKKVFGRIAEIGIGDTKQRLLLPSTYMNESGRSINAAICWFDIEINQVIIIVDDMDLPLGKLRIRNKGGSGGHKGLKSTISHLKTEDFCRLRIGIGAPSLNPIERKVKTCEHVLGSFSSTELLVVEEVIKKILASLDLIKEVGLERASNEINSYKNELII
ncbi:aminoacyl-tRNA hydrolase [Prochlorococcus sp. MIT 1223]|uniref:aminoacyl-tRNA hydrolase n=1 Tax=Prochlorococcus sp. MIT 1223 TaxID=3096217 RepID=UPI002A7605ED|nr:aminoacyl-tRNA hydrolase [Prochlorococcus sp. MIT 1223]